MFDIMSLQLGVCVSDAEKKLAKRGVSFEWHWTASFESFVATFAPDGKEQVASVQCIVKTTNEVSLLIESTNVFVFAKSNYFLLERFLIPIHGIHF